MIAAAITHIQKASTTPQSGHIALLEPFTERCDSLCGVAAVTVHVNTAERVVVQAVNNSTYMSRCAIAPLSHNMPNLGSGAAHLRLET